MAPDFFDVDADIEAPVFATPSQQKKITNAGPEAVQYFKDPGWANPPESPNWRPGGQIPIGEILPGGSVTVSKRVYLRGGPAHVTVEP